MLQTLKPKWEERSTFIKKGFLGKMHFKILINFYKWNNLSIIYNDNNNTQKMAEVSKNI